MLFLLYLLLGWVLVFVTARHGSLVRRNWQYFRAIWSVHDILYTWMYQFTRYNNYQNNLNKRNHFVLNIGLTLSISASLMNHMEYAFVVSTALVIQSCLFSGFFVNLSELGSFVESLATIGFYKLTNDSILMVVYGRDRCLFGSKVLTLFSLDDDDLWYNFWWLIGMAFVWRILGQIILTVQSNSDFLYSF